MQKQSTGRLTMRNACAVLIVIHISNSIVLGYPTGIGTDAWIAYLLSSVAVVPFMLLYGRLVHLMPGKDLFEMMEFAFGKIPAVLLSALYAYYFLTVSAIVRNYYAEFVHIVTLINTSIVIILLSYFVVCCYLAKSGTETLGKWSSLILALSLLIALILTVLSIPKYDVRHLMPVMWHGIDELLPVSAHFIPLPIGEAIIVMTMVGELEAKANPYKTFLLAGLVSVLYFAITFLRNCAILGEMMMETTNFSSYKAASVIQVGSIGTRIESMVAVVFILTGITKVAASLYAGAKATKCAFQLKDHNPILLSIGLFSVSLSVICFYNMVEMFEFVGIYRIYALPFQLLIPIVLWVAAELKIKAKGIPVQKSWRQAGSTS